VKQAAEDEFDKLLAELGDDKPAVAEPVEVPVVEDIIQQADVDVMAEPSELVVEEPVVVEEVTSNASLPAVSADVVVPLSATRMVLPALEGVGGLQVAFPAEVLAAALRPMVKDWVQENLASIVERLVKEEIGKLTQE
jgi:hypothetical protein